MYVNTFFLFLIFSFLSKLADVWFYWEFHWTKGIPIKPTEDLVSFYCGVILAVFQGLNLEIFVSVLF